MSMTSKRRHESGAAAVEAALVLPFLLLLLFGIVEFASAYAHQNDVRGAALTAARIAASTDGSVGTPDGVLPLICGSMDTEALGDVFIDISISPQDPGIADPAGSRGAIGRAIVTARYQSYTGFFAMFNNVEISQSVDFVVETPLDITPAWWPNSAPGFLCA